MMIRVSQWLDIRPTETRAVGLSFFGAFLAISFLIVSRSLREALFLTGFDIKTLPYMTAGVAFLGIPMTGLFTRLLSRHEAHKVLKFVVIVQGAGLLALWPFVGRFPIAVIALYLWTALGTLLLTSGFWVVTAELFALRSAKRLFGLISGGGTLGAMIVGMSLGKFTKSYDILWLIPGLVLLLAAFLAVQMFLSRGGKPHQPPTAADQAFSLRENLKAIWTNEHLKTIAWVVVAATLASTLLDYRFKELTREHLTDKASLAGFFGSFYGWTGAASLLIQLFLASRVVAAVGVGWSLAVLPSILLLGSAGIFFVPSLFMATAVRGADNTLRKSLHRSILEILYVPVPAVLRRKTKTFIDSVLDSIAEGAGALLIFLWVTLAHLPSRYLSFFVAGFSLLFFMASRKMGTRYFRTLVERLHQESDASEKVLHDSPFGRDLLSATFTRTDFQEYLRKKGILEKIEVSEKESPRPAVGQAKKDLNPDPLSDLIRLLARDSSQEQATRELIALGDAAAPHLIAKLRDDETDFVLRRRIPRVLAKIGGAEADRALLDALSANRFEIRYRAAIALMQRRKGGLPVSDPIAGNDWKETVWTSLRAEVGREQAIWEMQNLLDQGGPSDQADQDPSRDDFAVQRVGLRGELSLEHTFRLLALVRDDPQAVRIAYHGVILADENLKSFALEYLECVLPADIRVKLWPFIGDLGEHQRQKNLRPVNDVVYDLMKTGVTLFEGEQKRSIEELLKSAGRRNL